MTSRLALVSTLTPGAFITEADTPQGPFYEVAKVNRASIRLYLDETDHAAGTVPLRVLPTDQVRVRT